MNLKKKRLINNNNTSFNFINFNNRKGLKTKSINNFLFLLKNLKKQKKQNPFDLFFLGLNNIRIFIYLYVKKIGGSGKLYIPINGGSFKKIKKGSLIFFKSLKNRNERNLKLKILNEFNDVLSNKGATIKARNNLYIIASENRFNVRFLKPRKSDKTSLFLNNDSLSENNDFDEDISIKDMKFNYYSNLKFVNNFANFYSEF